MWYKYLIPRRVAFLNIKPFRWLNFIILPFPKKLEWKAEYLFPQNFYAEIPMTGERYTIGPAEFHDMYCYGGPNLRLGYRPSLDDAAIVCERHYNKRVLGLGGFPD